MANIKQKYENNVFDFIKINETNYRTQYIKLGSNWRWSLYEHCDKCYLLKNSKFTKGDNDVMDRPFNNVILPIANVNYRSEGFDVKNIELFVENPDKYYMSKISRKYHQKWAIENHIDTKIDESVVSYFDYGFTLVKKEERTPCIIQPQQIAFVDQTQIIGNPICLKHEFSIDELLKMKGKWRDDMIDFAVWNAEFNSENTDGQKNETPSKKVLVYELYGVFPKTWLDEDTINEDDGEYINQVHFVTYYVDPASKESKGISLFSGKDVEYGNKPVERFKVLKRDDIYGRAAGRSGIEELFHPQIWTNNNEIYLQQMLENTSKIFWQTASKSFLQKNKVINAKNNQVFEIDEGKPVSQMISQPINKPAFDLNINKWSQVARITGSASDPQLGLNPVSGTPLGTTEIVTGQGQGIHQYRQGQIADFWHEIYRDWCMDYIYEDIKKETQWLDEFSIDEIKEIADNLSIKLANKKVSDKIFVDGKILTKQEQDAITEIFKTSFLKGGTKRFIKTLKDEFKNLKLNVKFNIAGKQKDLYSIVNKLNGVFKTLFANPAILQNEGIAKLFNEIVEDSGLSPIDYASFTNSQQMAQQPSLSQQNIAPPQSGADVQLQS